MKQRFAIVLAIVMVLGVLSGCGTVSKDVTDGELLFIDEDSFENGYLSGGGVTPGNSYVTTGYIAVEPNTTYVFRGYLVEGDDYWARFVTEYDKEQNVLESHGIVNSITTDSETQWIRFTFLAGREEAVEIRERTVIFSAPNRIAVDTETPFRLYFDNVLTPEKYTFWVGGSQYLETRYYDEYLEVTALREGTHILPYRIYDEDFCEVDWGNLQFVATDSGRVQDATVLVLGDSMTNSGHITRQLLNLFDRQDSELTLLGTRGKGKNRHEGRGGWTAHSYRCCEVDGSYENAFLYDGVFNFSKYMADNGYSSPDYVVIQLGTNDVFYVKMENYATESEEILCDFEALIESIHDYDPSIEIILSITIPPTENQAVFTEHYETRQIAYLYRHNVIRFARDLQLHFAAMDHISFAAANCVVNTACDISDGVHPTEQGYEKMAKAIFDAIVLNQNKQ